MARAAQLQFVLAFAAMALLSPLGKAFSSSPSRPRALQSELRWASQLLPAPSADHRQGQFAGNASAVQGNSPFNCYAALGVLASLVTMFGTTGKRLKMANGLKRGATSKLHLKRESRDLWRKRVRSPMGHKEKGGWTMRGKISILGKPHVPKQAKGDNTQHVDKIYKLFRRAPHGWRSKENWEPEESMWKNTDAEKPFKERPLWKPPAPKLMVGRTSKTALQSSSSTLEMAPTTSMVSEFVRPSPWNMPLVRAAAILSGGAFVGSVVPFAAMLHLSAFGIWLGTNVWTTFVAGMTMFKNLPRQQFGTLQAKLFPQYFQMGAACTAIVLLTGSRLGLPAGPAAVSLMATLANLLYLEPQATSVMMERYGRENQGLKEPQVDKELKGKFNKLHGLSSLANLVALVALVAHGSLLATRLV